MTPTIGTRELDEDILAIMEYKQEFKRAFRPLEVFGLAFNIVGLVPSLASVLSSSVSNGGAASMVWGWAVGFGFILCIGMALGELASSAPTPGGLYYLTCMLSPPWTRNVLCWIVGYANTTGMVAGTAALAWGCTVRIAATVNIGSDGQLILTSVQCYGIYAAIVLSQSILCSLGSRVLVRMQSVCLAWNIVLCLIAVVALPIATPRELKNPPSYVFGNFTNSSGWSDQFAFILSLLAPNWTIGGYEAVILISEESSNAAAVAPWGMICTIIIAGVLGWVVNIILASCMGQDLSNVLDGFMNQPMAQIFLSSFGRPWGLVVWWFVILSQYMMGSSQLLSASRQTYAFARDGALPLSDLLCRMNRYTGTPVNTVWFVCGLMLLVGLLALASMEAMDAVFTINVTARYTVYMIPIIARLAFKNSFRPGPFSLGILGGPVAAIAVAYMLLMLVVFSFPSNPDPQVATMNYTGAVFGGVMSLVLVWYYFPVYGGIHWFRGPMPNSERDEKEPDDRVALNML